MKILFLAVLTGAAFAQAPENQAPHNQAPDIEQIMARVGRNQAKALDLRKDFTYHQKQLLRMNYGNRKLAREEKREYDVTPDVRGVKKELTKFEGHYPYKGKAVLYDRPGYHYKGLDIDGDLIDSMSEDMTNDKNSRDGIDHDLFPLTYHRQLKYDFKLIGPETYRGREVYRVSFAPKHGKGIEDATWKGEALIDQAARRDVAVEGDEALSEQLEFIGRAAAVDKVDLRARVTSHLMDTRMFMLTVQRAMSEAKGNAGPSSTTSIMKNAGSKIGQDRAELLVEIMGHQGLGWEGEGYTKDELDSVRGWLGGKATTIYGGSAEIQNNIIAKRILGLLDHQ